LVPTQADSGPHIDAAANSPFFGISCAYLVMHRGAQIRGLAFNGVEGSNPSRLTIESSLYRTATPSRIGLLVVKVVVMVVFRSFSLSHS